SAESWTAALAAAQKAKQPAPTALPDGEAETLRQFVFAGSPSALPRPDVEKVIRKEFSIRTAPLRRDMAALEWTHPGAPLRAMAMVDRPQPVNPRIFVRGNPGSPGNPVPRQFLEVLSGPQRKPFADGSGRLELANAIANRQNPLTARVFV